MHFLELVDFEVLKDTGDVAKSILCNPLNNIEKLRVKQLVNHYFNHKTVTPESWTDIAKSDWSKLSEYFPIILKEKVEQVADKSKTIKTLYELTGSTASSVISASSSVIPAQAGIQTSTAESCYIEAVKMIYSDRVTLCISCQVGCAMQCPFCATGMLGLKRNLTTVEIAEQIRIAEPTNIVFMGEGEPTHNLKNVVNSIYLAKEFGVNPKNVTVSTVGDIRGIEKLAQVPLNFRLAISLHAGTNKTRDKLIPMNKRFNIDQVIEAGFQYYKAKKRRVSIEYALMGDINDSIAEAKALARLLKSKDGDGYWCHINIIKLNKVEGSPYYPATKINTENFINTLQGAGIVTTVRDSRGDDIDAACGQLSLKTK
jgi:23S rRNA (adenine2503-C2)-methyltransferase